MIDVPYISQIDNSTRRNDCGCAAALMLARWVGKGEGFTVDALSKDFPLLREFDPNQDGTTATDVAGMLRRMGCTPADVAGAVYPHAALISYRNLPAGNRHDKVYDGLHWIVRLSDVMYHDPLNTGLRGANNIAPKEMLDTAIRRITVLERPQDGIELKYGTVTSDDSFLRVRASPSTSGEVMGFLANGARIVVTDTRKDAKGRVWYKAACEISGLFVDDGLEEQVYDEVGWCAGWLVKLDNAPTPPPVPTPEPVTPAATKPLVSLNVIHGGQRANEVMAAGAGGVFVSFNPGHARELKQKYPNALIVARPFVEGVTTIAHWKAVVELDSLPAGTVVTSVNENQSYGDDTAKALLDRAQWDEACLAECSKRGLKYAGGSFSFGCPNFLNPDIMRVLSVEYANLLRAGMWWNQHSYIGKDGSGTPFAERFTRSYPVTMADYRGVALTFNIRQSWWTCERVRFYTMLCGWHPSWCNFIFAECGLEGTLDMPGAEVSGGFAANPNTPFMPFMRDLQHFSGQPFEFGVDRKLYKSPVRGMFVFAANGGEKWAGYEVGHRIPEMVEFWR